MLTSCTAVKSWLSCCKTMTVSVSQEMICGFQMMLVYFPRFCHISFSSNRLPNSRLPSFFSSSLLFALIPSSIVLFLFIPFFSFFYSYLLVLALYQLYPFRSSSLYLFLHPPVLECPVFHCLFPLLPLVFISLFSVISHIMLISR